MCSCPAKAGHATYTRPLDVKNKEMTKQELYEILKKIELKEIPLSQENVELNLFGSDENSTGIKKLIEHKSNSIETISNKNNLVLSVISLFLGAFWLLPDKLSFHPTFNQIIKNKYFGFGWLILVSLTVVLWVINYFKKIRNERKKIEIDNLNSALKLNKIQNEIFTLFYNSQKKLRKKIFAQQEFTDFILSYTLQEKNYTSEIDSISSFILEKAVSKKILSKVDNTDAVSLDSYYQIQQKRHEV